MNDLTIQFIPYSELAYLTPYRRVKKLLELVSENKILIIQGKLAPEEEADLIQETMKQIRESKSRKKFKGIEIATISPKSKDLSIMQNITEKLATTFFGGRDMITIIGPATVVKDIRKDPSKIELYLRK
ncbi:DUF2073 domain-containing protein [Candidatus Pacearchaeota archaeon]|nr:DUF2073 domain-containing protein [Candidatus Pacearchaeota archaeon]